MPKIVLTVHEPTVDAAIAAVRSLEDRVDAFEIRVDRFDPRASRDFDPAEIRRASSLPMIYTRRSAGARMLLSVAEVTAAVEAGFDLIDVELRPGCEELVAAAGTHRVILSHHDFEGVGDVPATLAAMKRLRVAHRKIALTPRSLAENVDVLRILRDGEPCLTVLGMGERGLYSRILAPFFGSELVFTARDRRSIAAPGQLDLLRALEIYGEPPIAPPCPDSLFAVVGNPAAHSRSPGIHNAIFRELGMACAYSIIECDRLVQVVDPMVSAMPFVPRGISVTAPFKREAYEIASARGWPMGERASGCRSANTLVRFDDDEPGLLRAHNTDVDGFAAALDLIEGGSGSVAVLGAGGTARAAVWAAKSRGFDVSIFNRTRAKAESLGAELAVFARPFEALDRFDGVAVINTLTAGAEVRLPGSLFRAGRLFVDVGYSEGSTGWADRAREAGMTVFDGLDLLVAQAVDQSRLFVRAARGESDDESR